MSTTSGVSRDTHDHDWEIEDEETTHRGDTRVTLECQHHMCPASKTECI
jgi:hypothetical protein